ncbi:hypothetical protein GH714_022083 [Hevea brasiliensis]|uniref:Wbp11/ELF5/Saf1 N-terminal domain-containing protein n=1 Tax=Hevea brasiliensis TaxID=3981 RepID=A0A6A6MFT6_HEVBR|nr:hypothetical protein GH714_022083 [Hevea brasiliensis]
MKTTKGGKVMNPTDAYRKELRKKELKRNKKERKKVREVGILKKDPEVLREQIEKLELMKADGALDKARKHKKRQLEDTLNLVIKKRKEYEEKMKEGRNPSHVQVDCLFSHSFLHLGPPRRRTSAEEEERVKHPKPEDSVYYHPTLNPTGPHHRESLLWPRIPLSAASSSSNTESEDAALAVPPPPPPPPPPLPESTNLASEDNSIIAAPCPTYPPHIATEASCTRLGCVPTVLPPPPPPPGMLLKAASSQSEGASSEVNGNNLTATKDNLNMVPPPPPPRQPPPVPGPTVIPTLQSDVLPPGISHLPLPPPPPPPGMRAPVAAPGLAGQVAPPGVMVPLIPRPPYGLPPGPPPMMRPPLPPGPPPTLQEDASVRPTVPQKPSYVKSAAPTVVKRPLAQHTPELTAMVPASVRVRRETALPKSKPKPTVSTAAAAAATRPAASTIMKPESTNLPSASKTQSIDDSYMAFLEDMKALGALDA